MILAPPLRAAWVRPGGGLFPDQQKANRLGVDQFFWDANDPCSGAGLTAVLSDMRKAHWKVGITRNMRNEAWPDSETDPVKFGQQLSADITRLGSDGKQCSAIADAETHDMTWVWYMLDAFIQKRPGRFFYWTMEPRQGGLISPAFAAWINKQRLLWLLVQAYRSGMQPVSERFCIENLIAAGVLREKILVYYDRFEEGFQGSLFDFANI